MAAMNDPAACRAAIRAGWLYLQTKIATHPGPFGPLFQSTAWRTTVAALDTAALAGDLVTTQTQCRALWTQALAYRSVAETEKPEGDMNAC